MAVLGESNTTWFNGAAAAELNALRTSQQTRPTGLARLVATVASPFRFLARREQTLQELLRLDERMLSDVGLHRAEIYVAASKAARQN